MDLGSLIPFIRGFFFFFPPLEDYTAAQLISSHAKNFGQLLTNFISQE